MKKSFLFSFFVLLFGIVILSSCGSQNPGNTDTTQNDTISLTSVDTSSVSPVNDTSSTVLADSTKKNASVADLPVVKVYNFHITNRCVTCMAIEDATTKTLKNYFAAELKQGRIKREILNVDDDANKTISEKYQAFGSGLFVTRVFKGKETTTDLTGDGFKYAKNKEEKFIEILKNKITEYLK